jgi:hypothetical protein
MVIRIFGMPAYAGAVLPSLAEELKRSVACLPDANFDPSRIYVFFPNDLVQVGSNEELLTYVDTERKEAGAALNSVGQAVGAVLREFARVRLVHCRGIEVLVRPNHTGDDVIVFSM